MRLSRFLLCAIASLVPFGSAVGEDSEVALKSHQDSGVCPRYYYSVPWACLANSPRWVPRETGFPVDLHSLAVNAKRHLVEDLKVPYRLSLYEIVIQRPLRWQEGLRLEESLERILRDRWFVVLSFKTDCSTDPERKVAVLLDGTWLNERTNRLVKAPAGQIPLAVPNSSTGQIADRPELAGLVGSAVGKPKKMFEPGLELSSVQWNPKLDPFPLDLSTQLFAVDKLHRELLGADHPLFLEEIRIFRVLPEAAVAARGEDIGLHLNHWMVQFKHLWPQRPDPHGESDVHTWVLLDGTIVGMSLCNTQAWPNTGASTELLVSCPGPEKRGVKRAVQLDIARLRSVSRECVERRHGPMVEESKAIVFVYPARERYASVHWYTCEGKLYAVDFSRSADMIELRVL